MKNHSVNKSMSQNEDSFRFIVLVDNILKN